RVDAGRTQGENALRSVARAFQARDGGPERAALRWFGSAADGDRALDLLEKLRAIERRLEAYSDGSLVPGQTVIERVLGPCEVVVQGRPTLMFGSNNYLG